MLKYWQSYMTEFELMLLSDAVNIFCIMSITLSLKGIFYFFIKSPNLEQGLKAVHLIINCTWSFWSSYKDLSGHIWVTWTLVTLMGSWQSNRPFNKPPSLKWRDFHAHYIGLHTHIFEITKPRGVLVMWIHNSGNCRNSTNTDISHVHQRGLHFRGPHFLS